MLCQPHHVFAAFTCRTLCGMFVAISWCFGLSLLRCIKNKSYQKRLCSIRLLCLHIILQLVRSCRDLLQTILLNAPLFNSVLFTALACLYINHRVFLCSFSGISLVIIMFCFCQSPCALQVIAVEAHSHTISCISVLLM